MFVVVTVVCVWLGYHLNWIRQRHDFLEGDVQAISLKVIDIERSPGPNFFSRTQAKPPFPLGLFGQRGYYGIRIRVSKLPSESEADWSQVQLAKNLFPEAVVEMTDGIPRGPARLK